MGEFPRGAMRRPQGYPRNLERGTISGFAKSEAGAGILALCVYDGDALSASYVDTINGGVESQHADHHVVTCVVSTNGYVRITFRYKPLRSINTLPNFQIRLTDTVGDLTYAGGNQNHLMWGWSWAPNEATAPDEIQIHATLLETTDLIIVGDGNGMMEGPTGLTNADAAIPYQLATLLEDLNAHGIMYAVSGGDTALMVDDVAIQANAMLTTEGATFVLIFSHYHTDVLTDFEAYAAVIDSNIFVIAISCLIEVTFDAPTITACNAMNASLDASSSFDAFLDINADARFAHNNATYRFDGLYLTDAGAALVAELLEPIVRGLL
jgi:hypothetical protein